MTKPETPGSAALDEIYSRALCISEFVRRAWLAGSGEGPESAALVPNCADLDLFCPKAKAGEAAALRKSSFFGFTERAAHCHKSGNGLLIRWENRDSTACFPEKNIDKPGRP